MSYRNPSISGEIILAEREIIEKVKQKRGVLAKIQDFFLRGYSTREDLRELDKQLRDSYYHTLRDMRHTWLDIYLDILDSGVRVSNRDLKRVNQVLDRVMEKVHHADYGYAGLFDRKGHIKEQEIARVISYDKEVGIDINNMDEAINQTSRHVDDENWTDVRADVKKVKTLLYALEDKWLKREELFRPLDL